MLLSFIFNGLLFLNSLFTGLPTQKVFFDFFQKKAVKAPAISTSQPDSEQTASTRKPASKQAVSKRKPDFEQTDEPITEQASSTIEPALEQADFSDSEETTAPQEPSQQWKEVSPFKNGKLSLYQWENNQNILISIRKAKGQSIKKISDLQAFFSKMEKRKLVTFSKTSIKDRKVSRSHVKNTNNTALLYTSGTYVDFQKQIVVFEDFSFYHDKMSLHILVHNTQQSTKEETHAIYSFLEDTILSENSLALKEQKDFLSLIEQIKNENI